MINAPTPQYPRWIQFHEGVSAAGPRSRDNQELRALALISEPEARSLLGLHSRSGPNQNGESYTANMSGEIITILGVGVALAGLILTQSRGLRGEIAGLRGEIAEIRGEIGKLRERMAHLEGLLEGLREAITGRAAAS